MAEYLYDPDYYAKIRKYEFVSSSRSHVCIGKSGGSYNYRHIDDVYPRDKKFIPVRNHLGGIDYLANPNYHPKSSKDRPV